MDVAHVLAIDECIFLDVAHCFTRSGRGKACRSAAAGVHNIGTSMMKLAIGGSDVSKN